MHFVTQLSQALFLTDDSSAMRLDDKDKVHYAIEDITFSRETPEGEIVLYLHGEEQLFFSEQTVEVSELGKFVARDKSERAYEIMAWMNRSVTLEDITSKAHLRPVWGDAKNAPNAPVAETLASAQQRASAQKVLEQVCLKLCTPFEKTRVCELLAQLKDGELQNIKDLGRVSAFLDSSMTRRVRVARALRGHSLTDGRPPELLAQ